MDVRYPHISCHLLNWGSLLYFRVWKPTDVPFGQMFRSIVTLLLSCLRLVMAQALPRRGEAPERHTAAA